MVEQEPLHGYAIMEALLERSGGELDLPTGTLYPALRRLERAGYLASEWSTVGGRDLIMSENLSNFTSTRCSASGSRSCGGAV